MDQNEVVLNATEASLKSILNSSGTIVAPATAGGPDSNTVTIPHGLDTTDLIWNVTASTADIYAQTRYVTTPFSTTDGRTSLTSYIDANNLYIIATSFTAGAPQPAVTFNYTYNILLA